MVYLAYSKEDYEYAELLYNYLLKSGFDPWLDTKCLLPGQNLRRERESAIKRSSYFLALISENSISKKGIFQKELNTAFRILDEFPYGDIFIIPVRLDNCEILDERLNELTRIDFVSPYDESLQKISLVLRSKIQNRIHGFLEAVNEEIKKDRNEFIKYIKILASSNNSDENVFRSANIIIDYFEMINNFNNSMSANEVYYSISKNNSRLLYLKGKIGWILFGGLVGFGTKYIDFQSEKLNDITSKSDIFIGKIEALILMQKYDLAITEIDKELIELPDNPELYFLRGSISMQMRNYDEAILSFEKAIEFDPNYNEALIQLEIAIQSQNKAIELFNEAKQLEESGNIDSAINKYEEANSIANDFVDAKISYANLLAEKGLLSEATHEIHNILDSQHDSTAAKDIKAKIYCILSRELIEFGEIDLAEATLNKADIVIGDDNRFEYTRNLATTTKLILLEKIHELNISDDEIAEIVINDNLSYLDKLDVLDGIFDTDSDSDLYW